MRNLTDFVQLPTYIIFGRSWFRELLGRYGSSFNVETLTVRSRRKIVRLSAADLRLFFWLASQFIEQSTDELLKEVAGVLILVIAHGHHLRPQ